MALIIPRGHWTQRKPRPMTRQDPTNVEEFFLHWPGNNRDKNLREAGEIRKLTEWLNLHMDEPSRRWSFLGYSFVTFSSGRIYRGRGMDFVPAAQLGHNTNTVAVCCVGPITPKMQQALVSLKNHCDNRAHRDLRVRGHGEVTATECPGVDLRRFVPTLGKIA